MNTIKWQKIIHQQDLFLLRMAFHKFFLGNNELIWEALYFGHIVILKKSLCNFEDNFFSNLPVTFMI